MKILEKRAAIYYNTEDAEKCKSLRGLKKTGKIFANKDSAEKFI